MLEAAMHQRKRDSRFTGERARVSARNIPVRDAGRSKPSSLEDQLEAYWKRLSIVSDGALRVLDAATTRLKDGPVTSTHRLVASLRDRVAALRGAVARGAATRRQGSWESWVSLETEWLEASVELRRLVARPGRVRDAWLETLSKRIPLLEMEIGALLDRSERYRPRTRVEIGAETVRLRRRLEVLRHDAERSLAETPPPLGAGASAQAVEHAWSHLEWALELTRHRFSRPRWRQGREGAAASSS